MLAKKKLQCIAKSQQPKTPIYLRYTSPETAPDPSALVLQKYTLCTIHINTRNSIFQGLYFFLQN